ncbi:monovalent cation/H+ antiporter complex subunit F [Actinomycetes bacterium M1A6_2h]
MTVVLIISGVLLLIAAVITSYRLLAGPNTLDRLVAVDTLIALAACGIATWAVYSRDTTLVPAIVALSLVGFVGSVSVARFRVADIELGDGVAKEDR